MIDSIKKIFAPLLMRMRYGSRNSPDMYLHEYASYQEYKEIQTFHNKRKLDRIWADYDTLDLIINRVSEEFNIDGSQFALCHGTRNGFEQNYIASRINVEILGTDISDTASRFQRSVQWDFHDINEKWVDRCIFIYTNSLDQSWKPREAISTWLGQLKLGGLLFIEHTEAHGPNGAGEMDPFGVNPYYMPYLLADWFPHKITLQVIKSRKKNIGIDAWVFVVKKIN